MSNKIHGGELVVRALKEEGVEVIFSLSGGHIAPIYDSCIDHNIKIIDTRHEQAAAHMAEAYSRLTGKPGVCVVTAGPGFTDAVTGIANAYLSNAPLILISGRAGVNENDRLALQELDQLSIIKPITKWARLVLETHRLPEYIGMAFRHALTGRPGPVFLDIPVDVLMGRVEESKVIKLDKYRTDARPMGETGKIEEAIELLAGAKRPMCIIGSGGWYSCATDAAKRFAKATGVPMFTANSGRGVLADDSPDCYGSINLAAGGPGMTAMPQADVILLMGTRLGLFLFFGRPPLMNPKAKLIQVDIEATEIGRNRSIDLGIVGDVRLVLDQLADAAKGKSWDFAAWRKSLDAAKDRIEKTYEANLKNDKVPIHPQRLCAEVEKFMDRHETIVADGGDTQVWLGMTKKTYEPGHYLDSGLFGCLGVGIPFAIASKLARPDERVLLFTGDGSVGINIMEFNTAIRHNLPFVCVVNNDQAWGMIKHGQEMIFGKDRVVASELGTVHYEKVVEALGGYGEFVEKPEDIAGALERAFKSGKPAMVNVMTDPTAVSPGSIALAALGSG